jgi:sigma-B regulation protein RsbU (phosphoserine phosphatase)
VWERLASGGRPLGLFPAWRGRLGSLRLEPGDLLALFSDGVLEAQGLRGEEFGEARLRDALLAARDEPIATLPRKVTAAVQSFSTDVDDDVTVLVARAR